MPRTHSSYVALLSDIIDTDPSSFEEVAKKKWKKDMIKEYQLIMKKDVQDVVPRPKGNSVVSSIYIYKIKDRKSVV